MQKAIVKVTSSVLSSSHSNKSFAGSSETWRIRAPWLQGQLDLSEKQQKTKVECTSASLLGFAKASGKKQFNRFQHIFVGSLRPKILRWILSQPELRPALQALLHPLSHGGSRLDLKRVRSQATPIC